MSGIRIGQITHFFDRINVAVLVLTETIRMGDTIHFLGHSSDFTQEVKSLQIEHQPVEEAGAGQEVSIKFDRPVRPGTSVFKITEEG